MSKSARTVHAEIMVWNDEDKLYYGYVLTTGGRGDEAAVHHVCGKTHMEVLNNMRCGSYHANVGRALERFKRMAGNLLEAACQ